MSKLEWTEFQPRHYEANTDAAQLHVYRDSHDGFWSVHIGSLFIQDRTPMPFDVAKDVAESALECWENGRKYTALAAERDAHLATIRGTFSVLESRGQAPDDNAPLFVTVRRVLDYLDRVTAQRDALNARVELLEAYARADATAALYVGTERDALKAELTALRKRIADAPRTMLYPRDEGEKTEWVAHLRLEDGE